MNGWACIVNGCALGCAWAFIYLGSLRRSPVKGGVNGVGCQMGVDEACLRCGWGVKRRVDHL